MNNCCIVSFDVIRLLLGICDKQMFTKFLTILPNCPVHVSVVVDKYVNKSTYIFGFLCFLYFTVDLYILDPLKCFMKSKSIKSIGSIDFLFRWLPVFIVFFHELVKH